MNISISRLTNKNKRFIKGFDCGNWYINIFLQNLSFDNTISITYLMRNDNELIGFFSLCSDAVIDASASEKETLMAPAIKIYMLAIDKKFQRKKITISNLDITYAHLLLDGCISIIQNITSKEIGATFITVNSTKEGINLYKKLNFESVDTYDAKLLADDTEEKLTPMIRFIYEI